MKNKLMLISVLAVMFNLAACGERKTTTTRTDSVQQQQAVDVTESTTTRDANGNTHTVVRESPAYVTTPTTRTTTTQVTH